jgi:hypothetical protein
MYIMPGHTRSIKNADCIRNIVIYLLEVEYASIVVILAREEGTRKVSRVDVRKWATSMGL